MAGGFSTTDEASLFTYLALARKTQVEVEVCDSCLLALRKASVACRTIMEKTNKQETKLSYKLSQKTHILKLYHFIQFQHFARDFFGNPHNKCHMLCDNLLFSAIKLLQSCIYEVHVLKVPV